MKIIGKWYRNPKKRLMAFLASCALALSACGTASGDTVESEGETAEGGNRPVQVVTTIAQIAEPLSVIGGDRVKVVGLMGPGVDPHLYKATPGDIEKLNASDIVFYSGLHLEGNMTEIFAQIGKSKPVLAIAEAIPEEKLLHDENGQVDPHVWFDIDLWMIALDAATQQLKSHSPADAEYFEENKQAYFSQLEKLKQEAKEKLSSIPPERRVLVTAHDAFGYFGRMHGIEVVGLQGLSTEDEIGISDIQSTIDLLVARKIPAVFVESSVNQNSIKAVIEGAANAGQEVKLGGELFSDAMGEAGTPEGTYLGMYRHNVETIYQALQ